MGATIDKPSALRSMGSMGTVGTVGVVALLGIDAGAIVVIAQLGLGRVGGVSFTPGR